MERNKRSIVYLDTHIVVWLYAGLTEKLSERAKSVIEEFRVMISQMVSLEFQYLIAGPPYFGVAFSWTIASNMGSLFPVNAPTHLS